jgi:outer membrane protein assembly factor BamB
MSARQLCAGECGRRASGGAPRLSLLPLAIVLGAAAGCSTAVTSISPTSVAAGGPAFKLTVLGSGFSGSSSVQWNGSSRSTTYVSAKELLAQINAADITAAGSASVTVSSPGFGNSSSTSGGSNGTSNAETLSIVTPSRDASAYQIDPAHDGAMTFASVSFPSSSTWSVSVGAGSPSNIVIADSKVFLTTGTSAGSQLLALDQATGATAWGPKAIPGVADGSAGVAYDNGRVFVVDNESGASTLYAYDAGNGALDWSTGFGTGVAGAPTAADGYVYVVATGNATLYALDEAKGTITWQQPLSFAGGTPAVTADGVYVTATSSSCSTIDFRPATGEVIWTGSDGIGFCPQTAAGTPAVANQTVYSPNSSGTAIFAAETGSSAGTGTLSESLPAAFTSNTAYFLEGPNLDAVGLSGGTVQWTFNGDNKLATSPIMVSQQNQQYVIAGSSLGHLYAIGATSGNVAWTQSLAHGVSQLAVGDGLLVVLTEASSTSGGTLTAYTLSTSP